MANLIAKNSRMIARRTTRKPGSGALNCSESTGDYLERIQRLIEEKGYSRVVDVAKSLGVAQSSVSIMVRRLAQRGFLNHERYRGFTLTPAGRRVARHVKARRETLTEFLELLGLGAKAVNCEVDHIEHHLGPETLKIISKLVSFWQTHPARLEAFKRFQASSDVHEFTPRG
jgi:Mn-dependent DtxR family transcriptional regulator